MNLAETTADFALHGGCQFLLPERAAESAKRSFHRAEGAKFVAEFHGVLRDIAICKIYIAICNLVKRNRMRLLPPCKCFILKALDG